MRKKYVIFDFDGTMVNTNDVIIASWQAVYEKYLGHRVDENSIVEAFGETLVNTIAKTVPNAEAAEVRDYYRHYQNTHCGEMVYVFDGIRELLAELRKRGHKIGVATSRTYASYCNYMRDLGLEGCVDEVITMEDVSKHKPHPESITAVLEKFGAKPEEAIMIGDSKYDIGCANNAGVESALVGWSHSIDEKLMADMGFVPTYRISTPAELLEII